MSFDLFQIALFVLLLVACVKPLGRYMSLVYSGRLKMGATHLEPIEFAAYRRVGIDPDRDMSWQEYSIAVASFSVVSIVFVYAAQRLQHQLMLNPQSFAAVSSDSAFNTAVSFATNTNWQGYAGESTMSYLTQMSVLTVQNFLSAAVGMAVLIALIRGVTRKQSRGIGNFWVDLNRGLLFILLPMSFVLALVLVSQGVVQTFAEYPIVHSVESRSGLEEVRSGANPTQASTERIAVGPVASQVAIKQLGTNGGGFFNANSAHPFENPTPLSNLLQALAILLLPAALCFTFGDMIGDRRQGWMLLSVMMMIFLPLLLLAYQAESKSTSLLSDAGSDVALENRTAVSNMEGKEVRFGVVNSAIWAVATTAASNGSVNSMHDSYTPLGGMILMWLMQLGEVIFGGVGSGLYGMISFAVIAVFIAGLMVGRTPELWCKKIEAFEMKMAALVVLLPSACVLIGTAIAVSTSAGRVGVLNPGPHGFSEILYAFSSASNNNGSAFAGLSANTPFYNWLLSIAMLIGRFGVIFPVLAMAGSLASKKIVPPSSGTLPTHTPLFAVMLPATILLVGALSFFPALALGPIVEQLSLVFR